MGKTYWVYSDEENVDTHEEKHILSVRPSLTLAENIKMEKKEKNMKRGRRSIKKKQLFNLIESFSQKSAFMA